MEFLFSAEEEAEWRSQEPSERSLDFLPQRFPSMRLLPSYAGAVTERFERCLDLYLCPRQRRKKLNIDPTSLIPTLPKPSDLRPFPSVCSVVYRGHTASVRCIAVDRTGEWLVSGGEDGCVRLWEVATGRCFKAWDLRHTATQQQGEGQHSTTPPSAASSTVCAISHVAFCPDPSRPLISACAGTRVLLLRTRNGTEEEERAIEGLIALQTVEQREQGGAANETRKGSGGGEGEVEDGTGEKPSGSGKVRERTASWTLRKEKGRPHSTLHSNAHSAANPPSQPGRGRGGEGG